METLESTGKRIITVQVLGLWSISIYPLLKYLLSLRETALACCWAVLETQHLSMGYEVLSFPNNLGVVGHPPPVVRLDICSINLSSNGNGREESKLRQVWKIELNCTSR